MVDVGIVLANILDISTRLLPSYDNNSPGIEPKEHRIAINNFLSRIYNI